MEKDFEIMKKYWFIKPEEGMQKTLMCFGFSCDEGWYKLIEDLFDKFLKLKLPEDFRVIQVKEKYATIRIYVSHYTEEISNLIKEAEIESEKTCEICGSKDNVKIYGKRWFKNLCKVHGKEYKK